MLREARRAAVAAGALLGRASGAAIAVPARAVEVRSRNCASACRKRAQAPRVGRAARRVPVGRHRLQRCRRDDARDRHEQDPTCSIGFREPRTTSRITRRRSPSRSRPITRAKWSSLATTACSKSWSTSTTSRSPTAPRSRPTASASWRATHVTVALSGDGGDEDFLGYRRYRLFAMEERLRSRVPCALREPCSARSAASIRTRLGAARPARQDDLPGAGARRGRRVLHGVASARTTCGSRCSRRSSATRCKAIARTKSSAAT